MATPAPKYPQMILMMMSHPQKVGPYDQPQINIRYPTMIGTGNSRVFAYLFMFYLAIYIVLAALEKPTNHTASYIPMYEL